MGQQNPYDPSSWNTPAGQPSQFGQPDQFGGQPGQVPPGQLGQFGSGLPPAPPSQGIVFALKALAIFGGLVAAGIIVLAIGSNAGQKTVGNLSATPTVSTHYIKVAMSTRGLDETIYFKIVSTDNEKKAFVDGFEKGISKTSDLTADVTDIPQLPTNAVYVCQINLSASESLRSVQVYGVSGDNLSRDIAQGGCDGANSSR